MNMIGEFLLNKSNDRANTDYTKKRLLLWNDTTISQEFENTS